MLAAAHPIPFTDLPVLQMLSNTHRQVMSAPSNNGSLQLDRALVVTVLAAVLTLVAIFFAKRSSTGLAQGAAVG